MRTPWTGLSKSIPLPKAGQSFSSALDPVMKLSLFTVPSFLFFHSWHLAQLHQGKFFGSPSGSHGWFLLFGKFWAQSKRVHIWSVWVMSKGWDVSLMRGLGSLERECTCEDVCCLFGKCIKISDVWILGERDRLYMLHAEGQPGSVWEMRLTFQQHYRPWSLICTQIKYLSWQSANYASRNASSKLLKVNWSWFQYIVIVS